MGFNAGRRQGCRLLSRGFALGLRCCLGGFGSGCGLPLPRLRSCSGQRREVLSIVSRSGFGRLRREEGIVNLPRDCAWRRWLCGAGEHSPVPSGVIDEVGAAIGAGVEPAPPRPERIFSAMRGPQWAFDGVQARDAVNLREVTRKRVGLLPSEITLWWCRRLRRRWRPADEDIVTALAVASPVVDRASHASGCGASSRVASDTASSASSSSTASAVVVTMGFSWL